MLALLALLNSLPPQEALEVSTPSLISAVQSYQPGKAFFVGIRFTMQSEWHVYWRNPGDSGQEVQVKWTLPKGWKASSIHWPRPELHGADGLTTFIYPRDVVLPVRITPTGEAKAVSLAAKLSWLVCKEACIPGEKEISINLSPAKTFQPEPLAAAMISQAMALAPTPTNAGTATKEGKQITLRLKENPGANVVFLPYDSGVLDYGQRQVVEADGTIKLPVSAFFDAKATKRLRGIVLHINNASERPLEIDVPLKILGGTL